MNRILCITKQNYIDLVPANIARDTLKEYENSVSSPAYIQGIKIPDEYLLFANLVICHECLSKENKIIFLDFISNLIYSHCYRNDDTLFYYS